MLTRITIMADKNKKDPTPPPLLLMPASEGLTLNPAGGNSLLMPVPHTDASLFGPEEEGEADSFVGQTPPQQSPYSFFQSPSGSASDPFASVRQPDLRATPPRHTPTPPSSLPQAPPTHNTPMSSGLPPQSTAPPGGLPMAPPTGLMSPPSSVTSAPNQFRMSGAPRYAAPPPSMYTSPGMPPGGGPPGMSPMPPPPMAGGPPPMCAPPPLFSGGPPQGQPPSSLYHDPPPVTSGSAALMSPGSVMSPMTGGAPQLGAFTPVMHHWFYCKNVALRQLWHPFSITDSIKLEDVFREGHHPDALVSVEGGRYDVNMSSRMRHAVFWEENPSMVRRCSWFYKSDGDSRFVPYEEEFAFRLEKEYKTALATNTWHKKIEMDNETIIMHNANVIVHFKTPPDEWGTVQGDAARPRVVKRGIDDFDNIEDGELPQVDHVVFVVHGIGSTCDLRFRNIVECVDDFRGISLQILQTHFKSYQMEGRVGRVEFLPVRWHNALHGDATGIDRRLKAITLNSIGKLRHFTNDTLLDILFYASPAYSQQIVQTVGDEINRLYQLFLSRNPGFRGASSVAGHSLGSLILFDLLSNQGQQVNGQPEPAAETPVSQPETPSRENTPSQDDSLSEAGPAEEESKEEPKEEAVTLQSLFNKLSLGDYVEAFQKEQVDMESLAMLDDSDLKDMGLPMGPRKKLQGYLKLQKAKQKRKKEESERRSRQEAERQMREEAQKLAQETAQQELAARVSHNPLLRQASSTSVSYVVGSSGTGLPLVKYPQLDFHPTNFFALGSPIAMFQTVRGVEMLGEEFRLPTCPGFFNIFHPFDPVAYRLEPLVNMMAPPKPVLMPHHKGRKRLHLELKESLTRMGTDLKQRIVDSVKITWKTINDFALAHRTAPTDLTEQDVDTAISQIAAEQDQDETASIASSMPEDDVLLGQLNQGRRIDYVLQEKPIESFNDYLFALGSHACYWESEDTLLMILKEIYALSGIAPSRPGQPGPPPMYSPSSPPGGPVPFGSPTSFGAPPTTYGAPFSLSGAPPTMYGAPRTSYSAPATSYRAPPPSFEAPPTSISYGETLGPGMAPPTSLPMGMGLPPHSIAPPPMGMAPPPQGAALPPPPMAGFVRK